jgi:hypothetical protein
MKLKVIEKNEFRFISQELEDGSRIVSEQEANDVIQRMVDRRSKDYLEQGLSKEEKESYKEKQAWI